MSAETMIHKADEAVVGKLCLEGFIERHHEDIFPKMLEAWEAHRDNDLAFIAETIPIINAVIHVGSNREDLQKARSWAVKQSDTDPLAYLSALVFIYLVNKGEKVEDDFSKKEKWVSIHQLADKLLQG